MAVSADNAAVAADDLPARIICGGHRRKTV